MDSYGKRASPTSLATDFDNNIRSQSFSSTKRNDSSHAQSEDKFDESSSTTSVSTFRKVKTCYRCKDGQKFRDPLIRCSECSARWHASCHNPAIKSEITLKVNSDWRCSYCIRKHGEPSKIPPPESESLRDECEIPGCNKPTYSMLTKTKNDRALCKYHEMEEKSERSKLASKAQISALSKPSSKPIKKTKLYPVKYDEDMQGMKRKRGKKPGAQKTKSMSSSHTSVQSGFDNEPITKPQGISKMENILAARGDLNPQTDIAARGALHPRTDNSAQTPKLKNIVQPRLTTGNFPSTNVAWKVPKVPNRTIISQSPEYEPPSPSNFDGSKDLSPEYEPPSPAKVDSNCNVWQSDLEQFEIENSDLEKSHSEDSDVQQDDSPGSQIKDELRAMQESAKKTAAEFGDAFVEEVRSSSPFIPLSPTKQDGPGYDAGSMSAAPLNHSLTIGSRHPEGGQVHGGQHQYISPYGNSGYNAPVPFTKNNNPSSKNPLPVGKKVIKEPSPVVSPTPRSPAVPSTTKAFRPISPPPRINMATEDTRSPVLENEEGVSLRGLENRSITTNKSSLQGNGITRDILRLARKRKASSREEQEIGSNSTKEAEFQQSNQQNLQNATNNLTTPQPQEKPLESESSASQLQQKETNQEEPTHTAPLYGDYKPNTIEYQRQLRSKTYDSSVLDHYLNLQTESQAQAEYEREHNLMPQKSDNAAKAQIWGNIDPRVVWPKEQSESWYEAKRKEIDARGGKKANFGILLTAQVRKERSDRGWHPNQNKDYVPKEERNGGSIFVADDDEVGKVELAIRGGKLGVLVPVVGRDKKAKAEKKFLRGDR